MQDDQTEMENDIIVRLTGTSLNEAEPDFTDVVKSEIMPIRFCSCLVISISAVLLLSLNQPAA